MNMRYTGVLLPILALGSLVLSGCDRTSSDEGVRLALLPPGGPHDMALLQGTLWAEGKCLYITGPNGAGFKTMPVFEIGGLRWDERRKLLINGPITISHGQSVSLGGGEYLGEGRFAEPEWLQAPDPSCDKSDIFVAGTIDPRS